MAGGQRVQQLALHLRAGEAGSFLLHLGLDQFAQLVRALEAEVLGEIVVDLAVLGRLHRFHRDGEFGVLAGQVIGLIFFRERDLHGLLVTGLHALQLFFETGDEGARPDHQRGVFGLAAFEFGAVDRADEIDDDLVAIGRLLGLGGILVGLVLVRDALERFLDRALVHGHDQPFELQAVDFRRLDLGQDFQLDVDLGVLAFLVALAQLDGGLHRGAQALVLDQFVDRGLDRVVHHLRVQLFAVHLAHQIGGHLARTETRHAHLRGDAFHLGLDLVVDLARRNHDAILALQALIGGLVNLHGVCLTCFPTSGGDCIARRELGAGEGTRTPTSCDTWT